mgnify:CR=1 FL=1
MNNRIEQELIRLAFQDCSEAEAEAIRRRIGNNPEAQKLLETYSQMRQTLREMPTVEHQLSTERLRHAILNRGLTHEREPAVPFWRWVWMPVAALFGALLATLALPRLPGTTDPVLTEAGTPVGAAPVVLSAPGGETGPVAIASAPAGESRASVLVESTPTVKVVPPSAVTSPASSPVRSTKARSTPTAASQVATLIQTASDGVQKPLSRPEAPATGARAGFSAAAAPATDHASDAVAIAARFPAEAVASSVRAHLQNSEPIVLVGTDVDRETGAKRAIEVTSPSNVVVGS